MADQSDNGSKPGGQDDPQAGAAKAAENLPRLNVLAQYVKDLSFENPGAPGSLGPRQISPRINISINVQVNRTSGTDIEVALKLEASAAENEKPMFHIELVYAGLFRATNIPENQMSIIAMVECPRILFPFARQILAEASRNGGFPPLLIDPVDFAALYRDRLQREGAQGVTIPPPTLS